MENYLWNFSFDTSIDGKINSIKDDEVFSLTNFPVLITLDPMENKVPFIFLLESHLCNNFFNGKHYTLHKKNASISFGFSSLFNTIKCFHEAGFNFFDNKNKQGETVLDFLVRWEKIGIANKEIEEHLNIVRRSINYLNIIFEKNNIDQLVNFQKVKYKKEHKI